MTVANRSAPPGPIVPSLVYDDVEKAVDWLGNAFGFAERLRWQGGSTTTVELAVGRGSVFVLAPRVGHGPADQVAFQPPRPDECSQTLMVAVADIDAHFERAKAAGARVLIDVQTYPFGERQYSAQDLAGHVWTFTQSVADC